MGEAMAVNTMKDIINHGAECYGDQDAFRYKVRKEIRSKSYRQLKADCEAFSRGLESLGLLGKHIAVIGATSYFLGYGLFWHSQQRRRYCPSGCGASGRGPV